MKAIKQIGKVLFLIFTIYLTIPYILALQMKIEDPNLKNLDTKSFIFLGIILLFFIIINSKLFFPRFKIIPKNENSNS
ncbi:hypothetical protein FVB9288_01265 [Flavobacterium sp. CECT 9288]|nr:hypothetical protein FVB9288_01265 [Flavobacterium sp. CECT 9288]